ncbi:MAG: pyruvate dehydrogenase (acetyl-transferring) E1 component subunit alpha [Chloroflexi bacterium]|nr:pyruvate dehydrogenase (acetyl-transferring) E1 component subunit alpha [Chloroflexota bacterium]
MATGNLGRSVRDCRSDPLGGALCFHSSHPHRGQPDFGKGNRRCGREFTQNNNRDHGHALARGLDPKRLMAELLGRATGVSGGKGGSMHLADVSKGFWGGYGIVGGHIALAVGLALSAQYLDENRVVLCIFGEGSTNIGYFHEALNLASLWKLPVVFLCENNLYGMGTAVERASAVPSVAAKACAYNIPATRIDGMNISTVYEAAALAVAHVRSGQGPYLIEAMCYRFPGHSMGDPERYRSKDEVDRYREQDPILMLGKQLESQGILDEGGLEQIDHDVSKVIEAVAVFADQSHAPAPEALHEHVYAHPLNHREGAA